MSKSNEAEFTVALTVHNFSNATAQCPVKSSIVKRINLDYDMISLLPDIYPNGKNLGDKGYISIDFKPASMISDIPMKVTAGVAVVFMDNSDVIFERSFQSSTEYAREVADEPDRFLFEKFISRATLLEDAARLIPDDRLTILVHMILERDRRFIALRKFDSACKTDETSSDGKKFALDLDSSVGRFLTGQSFAFLEMCELQGLEGNYVELPLEELNILRNIYLMLSEVELYVDYGDLRDMCLLSDKYMFPYAVKGCMRLINTFILKVKNVPEGVNDPRLKEIFDHYFDYSDLEAEGSYVSWTWQQTIRGFIVRPIFKDRNDKSIKTTENLTSKESYSQTAKISKFSCKDTHSPCKISPITFSSSYDLFKKHCLFTMYANGRNLNDEGYVSLDFAPLVSTVNYFNRLVVCVAVVDASGSKRFPHSFCISTDRDLHALFEEPDQFVLEKYLPRNTLLNNRLELIPEDCLTLDIEVIIERDNEQFGYCFFIRYFKLNSAYVDTVASSEECYKPPLLFRESYAAHILCAQSDKFRARWNRGSETSYSFFFDEMECFRNILILCLNSVFFIDKPDELRSTCILANEYGFTTVVDTCRELIECSFLFVENLLDHTSPSGVKRMRQALTEFKEDRNLSEILNASRRRMPSKATGWKCEQTARGFKFAKVKETERQINKEPKYDFYM